MQSIKRFQPKELGNIHGFARRLRVLMSKVRFGLAVRKNVGVASGNPSLNFQDSYRPDFIFR
jgi:hypothetical protein